MATINRLTVFGICSLMGIVTLTSFLSKRFPSSSTAKRYGFKWTVPLIGVEVGLLFSGMELVYLVCAIVFYAAYFPTKHYMMNNIFIIVFCIHVVTLIKNERYRIGAILLIGLLLYMAISMATKSHIKITSLFLINLILSAYFSLIGVGTFTRYLSELLNTHYGFNLITAFSPAEKIIEAQQGTAAVDDMKTESASTASARDEETRTHEIIVNHRRAQRADQCFICIADDLRPTTSLLCCGLPCHMKCMVVWYASKPDLVGHEQCPHCFQNIPEPTYSQ